jgi:glycosyltransferase involved in cell wall biosynthesis
VHRRVAQAVFISRAVQAWFAARVRYPRPPRFITNGVDTALFTAGDAEARRAARQRLGLPLDRRIVLYVGRFLFMKGLPVIEALARRDPSSLFVLIGAGPLDPQQWSLPNVLVRPVQPQTGLRDYYWAGDVLVLPSTGEGFPLVVMEAMMCGTPAIVSAETYAAWNEGREHFLVSASTPEAVGAVLASRSPLLEPAARDTISAYARAHWDWDQVARDYVALMEEMIAAGAA